MIEASHKKINTVLFHIYEASRVHTFIEAESRVVFATTIIPTLKTISSVLRSVETELGLQLRSPGPTLSWNACRFLGQSVHQRPENRRTNHQHGIRPFSRQILYLGFSQSKEKTNLIRTLLKNANYEFMLIQFVTTESMIKIQTQIFQFGKAN